MLRKGDRARMTEAHPLEQPRGAGEGRRGTTARYILAELQRGILGGRFAPGQRLIEADLVREFGISRGPLREAFRLLSAEGLVELVPNRGAIVRRFSRNEVSQIYEIREALEGLAARLAAERISEGDNKRRLRSAVKPFTEPGQVQASRSFTEDNRQFHLTIVEIGGNERLTALIAQMHLPLLMFQLRHALSAQDVEKSSAEHRMIAETILAGRPNAADRAMRAHLRRSARQILNTLSQETQRTPCI
jgi:DNA-binding GntR family transcriptional regulator